VMPTPLMAVNAVLGLPSARLRIKWKGCTRGVQQGCGWHVGCVGGMKVCGGTVTKGRVRCLRWLSGSGRAATSTCNQPAPGTAGAVLQARSAARPNSSAQPSQPRFPPSRPPG
jgi:hypothetical protein